MALFQILSLCAALLACAAATGYGQACPTLFNYYPDSNDCTKFYRCNWGVPTGFYCPAGTRWSQKLLTCDHAKNVYCANGNDGYDDYDHSYNNHGHDHPDYSYTHDDYRTNRYPQNNDYNNYNGYNNYNNYNNYNGYNNHNGYTTPYAHYNYHRTTYPTHYNHHDTTTHYYGGHTDSYQNNGYDHISRRLYNHPSRYNNNGNYGGDWHSSDLFRAGYGYKKIYV